MIQMSDPVRIDTNLDTNSTNAIHKIARAIEHVQAKSVNALRSQLLDYEEAYLLNELEVLELVYTYSDRLPTDYVPVLSKQTYRFFINTLEDGVMMKPQEVRARARLFPATARQRPVLISLPREIYRKYNGKVKLPVPVAFQNEFGEYVELDVPPFADRARNIKNRTLLLIVYKDGAIYIASALDSPKRIHRSKADFKMVYSMIKSELTEPDTDRLYRVISKWEKRKVKGWSVEPEDTSGQYRYLDRIGRDANMFRGALLKKIQDYYIEHGAFWDPVLHFNECRKWQSGKRLPQRIQEQVVIDVRRQYRKFFADKRAGLKPQYPQYIHYSKEGYTILYKLRKTKHKRSTSKVPLSKAYREEYSDVDRIAIPIPEAPKSLDPNAKYVPICVEINRDPETKVFHAAVYFELSYSESDLEEVC